LTCTGAQFPARKAVEDTYEFIIDGQRRFDQRAVCSCDAMRASN